MTNFEKESSAVKSILPAISDILLKYFKSSLDVEYKAGAFSPVTLADKEAEKLIRETLSKKFPTYGFIGEETEEEAKDVSWIVDPLDGTAAFIHGLEDFGIAIALKVDSEIILSYLHIPVKNLTYHAEIGKGSFCNNQSVRVSNVSDAKYSLLSFGYENLRDKQNQAPSLRLATKHRIRIGHSSLIESTYLSSGKIDGILKFNQKIWDIAPEYLIMKEAGAKISDLEGKDVVFKYNKDSQLSYFCSNGLIHDEIIDILNSSV
ncbi:MAG TPA: inositol monophosphatase [Patescibacteria group bacterium]